ncbi:MAG: TetR/AcrR family transcriptional regulator, partial [Myxococcota bacterium]
IYQFFDDMDDVLDAVFERASALVHSALEEHRLEQHATEPSVFFPAIIATIDELQRNHPVMGCVVRPGQQGSLNNELAQRLRTQLVKRTVEMFVAAYPHAPRQRVADVIKLSATALFAVLAQSPAADDPCRGPYLADAASLAAVFVALKLRDATP